MQLATWNGWIALIELNWYGHGFEYEYYESMRLIISIIRDHSLVIKGKCKLYSSPLFSWLMSNVSSLFTVETENEAGRLYVDYFLSHVSFWIFLDIRGELSLVCVITNYKLL